MRRCYLRDQVPSREIAKRRGISRNTIWRYLRSEATEPAYAERQSASAIDPCAFQLSGWLKTEAAKSCKQRRSLKQLHEDLSELGFKGPYDHVAAFARQWREGQTEWVNSARKRTTYWSAAAFEHKIQLMTLIRPYQSPDMQACLDIFDGNTPRFFSLVERKDFENFLLNYAVAWNYLVIEDNASIVACGGYNCDQDAKSASFCWGMVANNLHGTGLGKMLTIARLKAANVMYGVAKIRLDTSQHTQGFYAQFGFVPERIIPEGYGPGLDRWEMTLKLENAAEDA